MSDDFDELPQEVEDEIRSIINDTELTLGELIGQQIMSLISEAREELQKRTEEDDTNGQYTEPYTSGPSVLWRITDQIGIDSDHATWWFVAISANEDGSPFCLVFEEPDGIRATIVERKNLEDLAETFETVEKRHLKQESNKPSEEQGSEQPLPSEVKPKQISENSWKITVEVGDPEEEQRTLTIRRAPALDHESLASYAIEEQKNRTDSDSENPIGTFWGHHAGLFAIRMEEAVERFSQ